MPTYGAPKRWRYAGPDVMRANEAAAAAIPVDQGRHLGPARGELRGQPELLEEASRVGRQRDGGADLAQLGGLFVDVDADAVLAQRDRQRQSANAGADDCDAAFVRCTHVVFLRSRCFGADSAPGGSLKGSIGTRS